MTKLIFKPKAFSKSSYLFAIIAAVALVTTIFYHHTFPFLVIVILGFFVNMIILHKTSWTIEDNCLIQKMPFYNLKVPLSQIDSIVQDMRFFAPYIKIQIKKSYLKKHLPNHTSYSNAHITVGNLTDEEIGEIYDLILRKNPKVKKQLSKRSFDKSKKGYVDLKNEYKLLELIKWIIFISIMPLLLFIRFFPGKFSIYLFLFVLSLTIGSSIFINHKILYINKKYGKDFDITISSNESNSLRLRGEKLVSTTKYNLFRSYLLLFIFVILIIIIFGYS